MRGLRFVTQANAGYFDIIDMERDEHWIARVWSRVEAAEIARLLNRHSLTKFLGRGNHPRAKKCPDCDRTEAHIHCPECGSVEHRAETCDAG